MQSIDAYFCIVDYLYMYDVRLKFIHYTGRHSPQLNELTGTPYRQIRINDIIILNNKL